MKKIILILIALVLILSCACSVNNTAENNSTSNSANNTSADNSNSCSANNTVASSTTVNISENSNSTNNKINKASFEIYLVKNTNNSQPWIVDLDKLELEEKPILTDKNISEYIWKSHRIMLIKDDELKKTLDEKVYMKTPVNGKPFVVVCNGEKIYCGAFWTLISSLYVPNLPTIISEDINKDYLDINYSGEVDSKTMESKNDVRNDKRIYETFKQLGKLK